MISMNDKFVKRLHNYQLEELVEEVLSRVDNGVFVFRKKGDGEVYMCSKGDGVECMGLCVKAEMML